jgi:POTRA domain, FtsQ-type
VTLRRHFLRGFGAVLVLAAALGGGWLWVRDSDLARVTQVRVTGATTSEEGRVRAALENAAREMSTLHVRRDVLDDAVAAYPSVAGLRVTTDFPHGMAIEVLEHRAVAALETDGRRVPVAGGGLVLTGVRAERELPSIRQDVAPPDGRVHGARTQAAVAVAAAAPDALRRRTERLWTPPTSGRPPRGCSRSRARPAPPISTSAYPAAWPREASDLCPRRTRRKTFNLRVRIVQPSITSRDFAALQRFLPRFGFVDLGHETPVTCENPRP